MLGPPPSPPLTASTKKSSSNFAVVGVFLVTSGAYGCVKYVTALLLTSLPASHGPSSARFPCRAVRSGPSHESAAPLRNGLLIVGGAYRTLSKARAPAAVDEVPQSEVRMGFYLRKSFRMGPLRLNVSKSGLGVSAGVRGARIGLTSQGRSYVHAGRYGLYMRQQLGSSARTAHAGRATRLDPVILQEQTDASYRTTSTVVASGSGPPRQTPRVNVGAGVVGAAAGLLILVLGSGPAAWALGGLILAGGLLYASRGHLRNRTARDIRNRLAQLVAARPVDGQGVGGTGPLRLRARRFHRHAPVGV